VLHSCLADAGKGTRSVDTTVPERSKWARFKVPTRYVRVRCCAQAERLGRKGAVPQNDRTWYPSAPGSERSQGRRRWMAKAAEAEVKA